MAESMAGHKAEHVGGFGIVDKESMATIVLGMLH